MSESRHILSFDTYSVFRRPSPEIVLAVILVSASVNVRVYCYAAAVRNSSSEDNVGSGSASTQSTAPVAPAAAASRDPSRDATATTTEIPCPRNHQTSSAAAGRRCDDGRHDDVSRDRRLSRPCSVDSIHGPSMTTHPATVRSTAGNGRRRGALGVLGTTPGKTGVPDTSSRRRLGDGGQLNDAYHLYSTDA